MATDTNNGNNDGGINGGGEISREIADQVNSIYSQVSHIAATLARPFPVLSRRYVREEDGERGRRRSDGVGYGFFGRRSGSVETSERKDFISALRQFFSNSTVKRQNNENASTQSTIRAQPEAPATTSRDIRALVQEERQQAGNEKSLFERQKAFWQRSFGMLGKGFGAFKSSAEGLGRVGKFLGHHQLTTFSRDAKLLSTAFGGSRLTSLLKFFKGGPLGWATGAGLAYVGWRNFSDKQWKYVNEARSRAAQTGRSIAGAGVSFGDIAKAIRIGRSSGVSDQAVIEKMIKTQIEIAQARYGKGDIAERLGSFGINPIGVSVTELLRKISHEYNRLKERGNHDRALDLLVSAGYRPDQAEYVAKFEKILRLQKNRNPDFGGRIGYVYGESQQLRTKEARQKAAKSELENINAQVLLNSSSAIGAWFARNWNYEKGAGFTRWLEDNSESMAQASMQDDYAFRAANKRGRLRRTDKKMFDLHEGILDGVIGDKSPLWAIQNLSLGYTGLISGLKSVQEHRKEKGDAEAESDNFFQNKMFKLVNGLLAHKVEVNEDVLANLDFGEKFNADMNDEELLMSALRSVGKPDARLESKYKNKRHKKSEKEAKFDKFVRSITKGKVDSYKTRVKFEQDPSGAGQRQTWSTMLEDEGFDENLFKVNSEKLIADGAAFGKWILELRKRGITPTQNQVKAFTVSKDAETIKDAADEFEDMFPNAGKKKAGSKGNNLSSTMGKAYAESYERKIKIQSKYAPKSIRRKGRSAVREWAADVLAKRGVGHEYKGKKGGATRNIYLDKNSPRISFEEEEKRGIDSIKYYDAKDLNKRYAGGEGGIIYRGKNTKLAGGGEVEVGVETGETDSTGGTRTIYVGGDENGGYIDVTEEEFKNYTQDESGVYVKKKEIGGGGKAKGEGGAVKAKPLPETKPLAPVVAKSEEPEYSDYAPMAEEEKKPIQEAYHSKDADWSEHNDFFGKMSHAETVEYIDEVQKKGKYKFGKSSKELVAEAEDKIKAIEESIYGKAKGEGGAVKAKPLPETKPLAPKTEPIASENVSGEKKSVGTDDAKQKELRQAYLAKSEGTERDEFLTSLSNEDLATMMPEQMYKDITKASAQKDNGNGFYWAQVPKELKPIWYEMLKRRKEIWAKNGRLKGFSKYEAIKGLDGSNPFADDGKGNQLVVPRKDNIDAMNQAVTSATEAAESGNAAQTSAQTKSETPTEGESQKEQGNVTVNVNVTGTSMHFQDGDQVKGSQALDELKNEIASAVINAMGKTGVYG